MVLELTVTEGNGLTNTVVVEEPVQEPLVPVTENGVVLDGETTILFPIAPLLHV
jgi:hypothetical protein